MSNSQVDRGASRPAADRPLLLGVLLVSIAYYAGSKLGFALTFQPNAISVLWPPNAILLGALLLAPRSTWWLFIAAALPAHFAAQFQSGVPLPMVLCWFVSNTSEALIGAITVRHFAGEPLRFDSLRNYVIFLAGAALLAPFVSSFIDAAFVEFNNWGAGSYWQNWRMRFVSNVTATLTITVAIVSWQGAVTSSFWTRQSAARVIEAMLLVASLLIVCLTVFKIPEARYANEPLLVYGSFPLLLWAAVRFGPTGTSASILLVAFLAIWAASHGFRPFGADNQFGSERSVQLFLIIVATSLMAIAVILREARTSAAAARSNEERLALAVEAARMQTWDWDLSTHRMTWSGTRVGGGGEVVQAATASEFLDLVHAEDRNMVSDAFEGALQNRTLLDVEFRVITPNLSQCWLLMRGNVHGDSTGKPARMAGISLNTTERKQIESQFRELREDLWHMNRVALLGELTGAMTHELNQPLTAILSNAEAGRYIVEKESPESPIVGDILHDIVLQGRRAAEVVRSLRTLLQKKQAEHRELDLNRIVRETLELERSALISRRVAAQLSLSPDVPRIVADQVQLQQVLLNLIMNACQAMAEHEAEGRRIILRTAREGDQACVSIQDNGPGIPDRIFERLFEPFFTTRAEGLGLGLAICQSIAVAHGGSLSASNSDGGGAMFELRLPIR